MFIVFVLSTLTKEFSKFAVTFTCERIIRQIVFFLSLVHTDKGTQGNTMCPPLAHIEKTIHQCLLLIDLGSNLKKERKKFAKVCCLFRVHIQKMNSPMSAFYLLSTSRKEFTNAYLVSTTRKEFTNV